MLYNAGRAKSAGQVANHNQHTMSVQTFRRWHKIVWTPIGVDTMHSSQAAILHPVSSDVL